MNVREPVSATMETGLSNLVGLAVASVAVSLTPLPFAASVLVGTVPAAIGGLWATCLLFGVALVGLFRFATAVADRGVEVAALPHVVAAAKRPRVGFELGAITFAVVGGALAAGLSPDAYRPTAVGVAGFLVGCWYLVVALAAPEVGSGSPLGEALRAGATRFARSPVGATSFLLLSLVCTAVSGLTVVVLVLFLPGVLGLLAVQVAVAIASPSALRRSETDAAR